MYTVVKKKVFNNKSYSIDYSKNYIYVFLIKIHTCLISVNVKSNNIMFDNSV